MNQQSASTPGRGREGDVQIAANGKTISGTLTIPPDATGIVVFAHGSGSSRFSPRNRFVAQRLQRAGMATLLVDLLTPDEEQRDLRTREHRFDIPLLADRLIVAADWLRGNAETRNLRVGYFGASTGAAAALVAAARQPGVVQAVVSRGGRPDLAGNALPQVQCPTLLIVGGNDAPVIDLNEQALRQLRGAEKQLIIVPGATHLFEEPGALEEVARLAADWFARYLAQQPGARAA